MLKELRKLLTFSQKEVTAFFTISKAGKSMEEIGQQQLPVKKMEKLHGFYKALATASTAAPSDTWRDAIAITDSKQIRVIKLKLANLKYKVIIQEKKLRLMLAKQERTAVILHRINDLKMHSGAEEKLLVAVLETNAKKQQSQSGDEAVLKLQLEIHNSKASIDFLETLKKTYKVRETV